MSWNPQAGFWSIEKFDSLGNAVVTTDYQTITGGHVTLLPNSSFTSGYISPWERVPNWTFDNGLHSLSAITGYLSVISGAVVSGETVTSYQRPVVSAGAWEFFTDYPSRTLASGYSGQAKECLLMWTGSPVTSWSRYFSGGGTKATIELDVLSLVNISGTYTQSGFVSGQNNVTSLSGITGVYLNHGIYLDNDTNWDYLEISPRGIRSMNHPEIALPVDFTQPRKIRIAINNADLFIALDDGSAVVGAGKFNTACVNTSTTTAKIGFGAPSLTGEGFELYTKNIKGIVGNSLWDNIKIITGQAVLYNPTGYFQTYNTAASTLYTESFNPRIGIAGYSAAIISFLPYTEGTTSVVFQSSGSAGWVDGPSVNLTTVDSPYTLDLSTVSSYNYAFSTGVASENYSRFKIIQQSNGISPPPPVEEIHLICSKDSNALLSIYPNWKSIDVSSKIYLSVDLNQFNTDRPQEELWSTLLLNTPNTTGSISGVYSSVDQFFIRGSGEVVPGGRYGTMVRNYTINPSYAVQGSDAETYFGSNVPVHNIFPNQYLDEQYTPVESFSNYVTGRVYGSVAGNAYIPTNYTGKNIVNYIKREVYRPVRQADYNRYNTDGVNGQLGINEFSQRLFIPAGTSNGVYDGTEGIEFAIPSGIVTSDVLVTLYTQITQGSSISVYATGNLVRPYSATVNKYTDNFFPLSFVINGVNSGQVRIGVTVPSGTSTNYTQDFTIDNVVCNPFTYAHFTGTGHSTYYYHTYSGLILDSTSYGSTQVPRYLDTVFSTDIYLESYPTGVGLLFEKLRTTDSKGFSFKLNSQGYPVVEYDLEAYTRLTASGATTYTTETFDKRYLTGEAQIPLGQLVNVGFVNQSDTYDKLGWADYPSSAIPYNFASCNRSYIVIEGLVVASADNMRTWNRHLTGECAPYITYIPEGTGTIKLMTGFFGGFDALRLKNDVAADAEVELSIKGSKFSPYFVPDKFSKPNLDIDSNYLNTTGDVSVLGDDLKLASIYNFYNHGYPCWDHGPLKNHLILYGSPDIYTTGGPYSGMGYTVLSGSNYAKAPYSSSFDRLFNTTGNVGLSGSTVLTGMFNQGTIRVQGWVMPLNTGAFFYLSESDSNPLNGYFSIGFNSGYKPVATRRSSNSTTAWSYTGTNTYPQGEWSWFNSTIHLGNYSSLGQTGTRYFSMTNISGVSDTAALATGANYGFQYYGRSGTSSSSCILLGYSGNVGLADLTISFTKTSTPNNVDTVIVTGSKGGRFNTLIVDQQPFTGRVDWVSLNTGELYLQKSTAPDDNLIYVAGHNGYDAVPTLAGGITLFDDELFKHAQTYSLRYDFTEVNEVLGSTNSPMQIGFSVPVNSVNIAKLSMPKHSVLSSLASFDLSEGSKANILGYDSVAAITRSLGSVTASTITGAYKGINEAIYSGRVDVIYSGQSYSKDVSLSPISIADPDLVDENNEAFYAYLIGRGNYGTYVSDSYPHMSGSITGANLSNYSSNLEKIRNSLRITDSAGVEIPFEQYPFDVVSSPYRPSDLIYAVQSGLDIKLDGVNISGSDYTNTLPTNVFSTVLLIKEIPTQTYWINYPAYRYSDDTIVNNITEVINPISIMRELKDYRIPVAGTYSVQIDPMSNQKYNVTIYGIDGAYSGNV